MKVSVVIPNYNGRKELLGNLPKVLTMLKVEEVIVVDDASDDDSVEVIRNNFPKIIILQKSKNEGFSSSVNEGVKNASGELILLLNHDVFPQKDLLIYLLPHFKDKNVFAVACLEKSEEKGEIILRGRGIGKFERGFLVHRRGEIDKYNTLWAGGGASIFRKDIWKKLGGMDNIYDPFYWEDIDLSYRAQKAGYKILFEPKSIVTHRHEYGAIRNLYSEKKIKLIAYRNQILFVWLNITDILYLLEHLFYLSYYLLKAIISGDFIFIQAFMQAIILFPKVLVRRFRNLNLNKKSDREILNNYLS